LSACAKIKMRSRSLLFLIHALALKAQVERRALAHFALAAKYG
jgi:hypothetical protein